MDNYYKKLIDNQVKGRKKITAAEVAYLGNMLKDTIENCLKAGVGTPGTTHWVVRQIISSIDLDIDPVKGRIVINIAPVIKESIYEDGRTIDLVKLTDTGTNWTTKKAWVYPDPDIEYSRPFNMAAIPGFRRDKGVHFIRRGLQMFFMMSPQYRMAARIYPSNEWIRNY